MKFGRGSELGKTTEETIEARSGPEDFASIGNEGFAFNVTCLVQLKQNICGFESV